MGTLYHYEMKKLLSQKVLWIAFFIMTALIVAQGVTRLIVGNLGAKMFAGITVGLAIAVIFFGHVHKSLHILD